MNDYDDGCGNNRWTGLLAAKSHGMGDSTVMASHWF